MTAYPLNVFHIGAGRYRPNDMSHSTAAIWRELAKGFRTYTVVGRSSEGAARSFSEGNLRVHLLPSWMARELEFLPSQFFALRRAARPVPDVTVAQCPMLGGLAGLTIRRRSGARLFVELHGYHYFTQAAPGSSDWVVQRVASFVLPRSDRIRVLSQGMKACLLARYGEELDSRTVVVPPRVDLTTFSDAKRSYRVAGPPRIAMSGAVNDNKGQLRLIRTLARAGLDAEIWIFGNGPQRDACEFEARKLGMGDKVRFFGAVAHATLAEKLPQADLFVQNSKTEGTPRALMEAMALGLPIVSTNAGFSADILEHGREGIILASQADQDLVTQINLLLSDKAVRAAYGRAAADRARREFDAAPVFERYRQAIAETAAR